MVLKTEPRASCMLGEYSIELHLQDIGDHFLVSNSKAYIYYMQMYKYIYVYIVGMGSSTASFAH